MVLLLFASFLGLYYPVFLKLIQDWEVDPNYSHGYFIPLIAAYMIWLKKDELKQIDYRGTNWGLILVIPGLLQFFLAWVGSEYFLQGISLIVVLLGSVIYLWGGKAGHVLLVPILYLIFMIPLPAIIWNQLSFPLALTASKAATWVAGAMGLSILREGNVLTMPNITLQVAEACSGLRSLTTLLALSALLAYISSLKNWKKWVLFLAAVPVAVLGNIFRLTTTALLANRYGSHMAEGFIHEFSGMVVFIVGLIMLLLMLALLSRLGNQVNIE
ncbi:MAG: exosortase/archaeosortase family protein [Desulfobia sp.]